ncbi:MAG: hypothetical protein O3A01_08450, partial [bacterium]|nr:hypothetical protein [bacterium]
LDGNFAIAHDLAEQGNINLNQTLPNGQNILHITIGFVTQHDGDRKAALVTNSLRFIHVLMNKLNPQDRMYMLQKRDNTGHDPLHFAIKAQWPACMELLLETGAYRAEPAAPNMADSWYLTMALATGKIHLLKLCQSYLHYTPEHFGTPHRFSPHFKNGTLLEYADFMSMTHQKLFLMTGHVHSPLRALEEDPAHIAALKTLIGIIISGTLAERREQLDLFLDQLPEDGPELVDAV